MVLATALPVLGRIFVLNHLPKDHGKQQSEWKTKRIDQSEYIEYHQTSLAEQREKRTRWNNVLSKEYVAPTVQFLFSADKRFQQFLHCVTGCFFWATVQIIQHQTFFEFFERGGSTAVAYTADRPQLPAILSGANRVQLMLVQRCKTCNERGAGPFAPPPAWWWWR